MAPLKYSACERIFGSTETICPYCGAPADQAERLIGARPARSRPITLAHMILIAIAVVIICLISCWVNNVGNIERSSERKKPPPFSLQANVRVNGSKEQNKISIKIVTPDNRARLCPRPDCKQGEEIGRIPTNTLLRVESSHTVSFPILDVIWFKVKYQGIEGWVSEFDTDKAPKEPRYK